MIEEKKKKSKGLVFLIILLILVILGLVGFILYDKGIILNKKEEVKEEKKEKVENKEEEKITFSDSELERYVNYISPISIGPSAKLYDVDNISAEKLSAAEKISYIGSLVFNKEDSSTYSIKESDVKDAVEEAYGPNTYQKTTFTLGCGPYTLNESDGKYYTQPGCGGTTATIVENEIIDYKATKDRLEITTAYAFLDGMTNKIYKDFNNSNVLDNYNESAEEANAYLKNYIKDNKDKLSHIIYIFESKDGRNYYFKEFTNKK